MEAFLTMVEQSGRSSWELLQDITPTGAVQEQAMAVALTVAERALNGRGAAGSTAAASPAPSRPLSPWTCWSPSNPRWRVRWARAAATC